MLNPLMLKFYNIFPLKSFSPLIFKVGNPVILPIFIDLTWLWYHSSNLRKLKWYRVVQVARISPEEDNWTNEPLKQPLTTHLRIKVIVSRNQQQEFHTLLAIIVSSQNLSYQTLRKSLNTLPNSVFLPEFKQDQTLPITDKLKKWWVRFTS